MTPATCVDLAARFGARYRLREEAAGVTWVETPEDERIWLWELPCRYGVVYPYGGDLLAAVATGRVRQRVGRLPCIRSRRGDEELVVTFPVDDAEAVLTLLRPYRRRQVSAAERERLRAMGAETRFAGVQSAQRGEGATHGAHSALKAQPAVMGAGNPPETAASAAEDLDDPGSPVPLHDEPVRRSGRLWTDTRRHLLVGYERDPGPGVCVDRELPRGQRLLAR